jgi:hypothetical protein
MDKARYAKAKAEQLMLLGRVKLAVGKTREMQHTPKTIARTGKMQTRRTGIKTGVNTAKQNL